MLDFTELSSDGRELEQLTRELLLLLDYEPHWSGVGPDGGRDLIFVERGNSLLGSKGRRWLVSCKHYAASRRAVGADDLGAVIESCAQHSSDGFLLVCTTHPSSAASTRLRDIEWNVANRIVTHVWDGVKLEQMLSTLKGWALAQHFLPLGTAAQGLKVFATNYPNRWIVVHRGYYIRVSNRIGSSLGFQLGSIDRFISRLEAISVPSEHFLRLRGVWYNDKSGGFAWHVDYLVPTALFMDDPESQPSVMASREVMQEKVRARLGDGTANDDGQFYSVEVRVRECRPGSDHFDLDHYEYYADLPDWQFLTDR